MYHVVFKKATGKVVEKGVSDVSRFSTDPAFGVLDFPMDPWPEWASVDREFLVVDNPTTSPVLREMIQIEKDASRAEKEAEKTAFEQAKRNGELALLDSLVFAEEYARAKGTAEAAAKADRIVSEINRRKATLGLV